MSVPFPPKRSAIRRTRLGVGACVVASPSLAAGDALPESVELPTLTPRAGAVPRELRQLKRASRSEVQALDRLWPLLHRPGPSRCCWALAGRAFWPAVARPRFSGLYQTMRGSGTDRWAEIVRPLGNGWYVIPACVGLGIAGAMFDETSCGTAIGQFGGRASRAYAVGLADALLKCPGRSRPDEPRTIPGGGRLTTQTRSGHAFVSRAVHYRCEDDRRSLPERRPLRLFLAARLVAHERRQPLPFASPSRLVDRLLGLRRRRAHRRPGRPVHVHPSCHARRLRRWDCLRALEGNLCAMQEQFRLSLFLDTS